MVLVFVLEIRSSTAFKKLSALIAPNAHNITAVNQLRTRIL